MKYRKKPVVIEAFRYGIDPQPDWFCDAVTRNSVRTYGEYRDTTHCMINTLEGIHRGERGDWIIKGIKGEICPCKPDIFAATYEAVDE